jgi:hypothetical protein
MEQFFIFLAAPFHLSNAGIEPFLPSGFALFGGFAVEEGGDAGPLLFPVFHHCRFEDFIFGVFPDSSFYKMSDHCEFEWIFFLLYYGVVMIVYY